MMVWNLFLAWIPLCITAIMQSKRFQKHWMSYVLGILWILFFPNAIYLISDLVYLDQSEFMISSSIYGSLDYLKNFSAYVGFFHLVFGAILGVFIAIESVLPFLKAIHQQRGRRTMLISMFMVSLLASVAVYIGRFFRYNSWDIFNIWEICKDLFHSIGWFSLMFVLCFSIIQVFIYSLAYFSQNQSSPVN